MSIEHASDLEGLRRAGTLVSSVLSSMHASAIAGSPLVCRRGFGAQFEHTVVVTSGEPIVLT